MFAQKYDITETPLTDESTVKYDYNQIGPVSGSDLNLPGTIRFDVDNQSLLAIPSDSYLYVRGRLTKEADGGAYANDNAVSLINNAIMYLFRNFRYELSGQEVESLNNPGQATTMLGLLKYPDDFARAAGLNQLWYKDTTTTASLVDNLGFKARQAYIIQIPTTKGKFSFAIPLSHIFGFCEDYQKIIYGFKHSLTIERTSNNDAIYRDVGVDAGKVTLDRMIWYLPTVTPNDSERFSFNKTIESKVSVSCCFRARQCEILVVPTGTDFQWTLTSRTTSNKPRWLILGFQTSKSDDQTKNPAIFDHVNVRSLTVSMSEKQFPQFPADFNFSENDIAIPYNDVAQFGEKFYGMDQLIKQCNISSSEYKSLFPIFVVDLSKAPDVQKTSIINVQINAKFTENPPPGTKAYALVLSDKMMSFKSDGSQMSVVY